MCSSEVGPDVRQRSCDRKEMAPERLEISPTIQKYRLHQRCPGTQKSKAIDMGDDYEAKTKAFLEWFRNIPGATFHDDIEIVDLRHRGAGRGIS